MTSKKAIFSFLLFLALTLRSGQEKARKKSG
jgi:hypothetical protein